MNILITGGAGFIGSYLTKHLLKQEHNVVIVDDLSTGRRENVSDVLGKTCQLLVQTASTAVSDVQWVAQFDQIYHLAAAVGVRLIVDEPAKSIETNIIETSAVIKAAAASSTPLLITSSSEVYGKSDRVPFSEDDDVTYGSTTFSRWSYAASKAIDEFLALAYHKQSALPVVLVRLFNTVGPGQLGQYGMVIPRFIKNALANMPIEIYGDGSQSRCFCHVTDIVHALPQLLSDPKCAGRVFNLGSDEEITIEQLADQIISMTQSKSKKIFVPYEQAYQTQFDDLPRRVPNLTRVKQAIGFQPTYNLDTILEQIIRYENDSHLTL